MTEKKYPPGMHPNSRKNLTVGYDPKVNPNCGNRDGARGKPTSEEALIVVTGNLKMQCKHSYYLSGFAVCNYCPYFQKRFHDGKVDYLGYKECPAYSKFKTEDGGIFCLYEIQDFDKVKAIISTDFELKPSDLLMLDHMIFKIIYINRARKYLSLKGPDQRAPLFNPKTGKTHWMDTPNVLDKSLHMAEKSIRDWLENLKMSRISREPIEHKHDVALEFVQKKEISITDLRNKTPKKLITVKKTV